MAPGTRFSGPIGWPGLGTTPKRVQVRQRLRVPSTCGNRQQGRGRDRWTGRTRRQQKVMNKEEPRGRKKRTRSRGLGMAGPVQGNRDLGTSISRCHWCQWGALLPVGWRPPWYIQDDPRMLMTMWGEGSTQESRAVPSSGFSLVLPLCLFKKIQEFYTHVGSTSGPICLCKGATSRVWR